MDLFVYGDESGVFSPQQPWFVFGGLILVGKEMRSKCAHAYRSAQQQIAKEKPSFLSGREMKAVGLSAAHKDLLVQATEHVPRYAFALQTSQIPTRVFESKKLKQRYLDYAYREGLSAVCQQLIARHLIDASQIQGVHIFLDEHTSATNAQYELHEELEEELKIGQFNEDYTRFELPVFPALNQVNLAFCDSKTSPLIQAADLVSNHAYHRLNDGALNLLQEEMCCVLFPPAASTH